LLILQTDDIFFVYKQQARETMLGVSLYDLARKTK